MRAKIAWLFWVILYLLKISVIKLSSDKVTYHAHINLNVLL